MSDIHVYTTDGKQSVHAEERIPDLLQSGEIPFGALYWRQGMTDWQPLSTFQPSSSPQVHFPIRRSEPPPEATSRRSSPPSSTSRSSSVQKLAKLRPPHVRFRRYPEPLTTVLQVFLIVCIGLSGIDLANAFVHYNLISSQIPDLTTGATLPAVMGPAELLFFRITAGMTLVTLLPYLMWVYQANVNSRNFSPIVRFSKGWAVGCNFVPAVNLFMPCQVMQEIWKVSRNPRTWHNDRSSILVGTWWALWLLREFGYIAYGGLYARAKTDSDVATIALVGVILFAVQTIYFGVFFAMITTIVQNQKRQVAAGRRRRAASNSSAHSAAPAVS